ncbi:MAG: MotA/TolQ/ExbB proton channel family protein, partial [Lachnospiraceae bacterium]|nr:MotA/TolQ/ExbB proton channel family protein [Lachnospiraceae bacterium]
LLEVAKHKNLSNAMKESLAVSLLENYNVEQDRIVKRTELIVKLGPVFGLLGTLTPLGPGIIALSNGDTQTLSQSLLVAFDTTVVGLICAAVCTCISQLRKRWYAKDSIMLNLLMEAVVESECSGKR